MRPDYVDRRHGGQVLSERLGHLAGRHDVVVLGLVRGGVPVAYEVATRLGAPLDIAVVRKLGVPGHEELAMGAIAPGGVVIVNNDLVAHLEIPAAAVDREVAAERCEVARRETAYRDGSPALALDGRVVVLVDDGLATGASMRAAIAAVRVQRPGHVVVAVPTGSARTCDELARLVDEVVCARTPARFVAVGQSYQDFTQTSDDDVRSLLAVARARPMGT